MSTNKYGQPSVMDLVRKFLADGKPRTGAEILAHCMDHIPASAAARSSERLYPKITDLAEKVMKGKRYLVRHTIDCLVQRDEVRCDGKGIGRIVTKVNKEESAND